MKNNLLAITKEGRSYIICSTLLFVVFAILDCSYLQFFTFLSILFFLFIFRNPQRLQQHYQDNSVTSPVDGVITSIKELKNNDYLYKIEINSSYGDVSLLRVPFNSSIEWLVKQNGTRLSMYSSLSKNINENVELIFIDEKSNKLKILHRLKQSFMGLNIKPIVFKNIKQGSKYGVMLSGTTTLYLPKNFRLNVDTGGKVIAFESLIGYFTKAIN
ncbi:MAG: phosphatidylserine decarboxylase [Sulfurimonas sp.]|nr:phosphatidylserine decarboxylase [Sulfurimonas sp.]